MAVPVFVVLSRELGNSEICYWLTVAAFGVFQLILLFRHINFYWGADAGGFSAFLGSQQWARIGHLV